MYLGCACALLVVVVMSWCSIFGVTHTHTTGERVHNPLPRRVFPVTSHGTADAPNGDVWQLAYGDTVTHRAITDIRYQ